MDQVDNRSQRSLTLPRQRYAENSNEFGYSSEPRQKVTHVSILMLVFSERELTFTFAICCRPSVCLSVVLRRFKFLSNCVKYPDDVYFAYFDVWRNQSIQLCQLCNVHAAIVIFYYINSLFIGHHHRKTEVQRFIICCCWPFAHQITLPIYLSPYSRECVNFCYALLAGRGNGTAYRAGCVSVFLSVYVCVWRRCIASKPINGSSCFWCEGYHWEQVFCVRLGPGSAHWEGDLPSEVKCCT